MTPELARIYKESIMATVPEYYTEAEACVWASFADDQSGFSAKLADGYTIVGFSGPRPIAFGQLFPEDYIALLFVEPEFMGRGVGRDLYERLELRAHDYGVEHISTHASLAAREFFLSRGFRVRGAEVLNKDGAELERYDMVK